MGPVLKKKPSTNETKSLKTSTRSKQIIRKKVRVIIGIPKATIIDISVNCKNVPEAVIDEDDSEITFNIKEGTPILVRKRKRIDDDDLIEAEFTVQAPKKLKKCEDYYSDNNCEDTVTEIFQHDKNVEQSAIVCHFCSNNFCSKDDLILHLIDIHGDMNDEKNDHNSNRENLEPKTLQMTDEKEADVTGETLNLFLSEDENDESLIDDKKLVCDEVEDDFVPIEKEIESLILSQFEMYLLKSET